MANRLTQQTASTKALRNGTALFVDGGKGTNGNNGGNGVNGINGINGIDGNVGDNGDNGDNGGDGGDGCDGCDGRGCVKSGAPSFFCKKALTLAG